MRLFVAVLPGAGVRQALAPVLEDLRGSRHWRAVAPAKLHVTCKFLGEVDATVVPAIAAAVRALAPGPLMLGVDGLGTFPPRGRARVLWAAMCGDVAALGALAGALDAALRPLGFAPEARPFHPHLTLARAPRGAPAAAVPVARVVAAPEPIAGFHLMASTPGPGGSVYAVVD